MSHPSVVLWNALLNIAIAERFQFHRCRTGTLCLLLSHCIYTLLHILLPTLRYGGSMVSSTESYDQGSFHGQEQRQVSAKRLLHSAPQNNSKTSIPTSFMIDLGCDLTRHRRPSTMFVLQHKLRSEVWSFLRCVIALVSLRYRQDVHN
jgi:hypothetical protein